jgi:N-acetylglucosaminyldiphosphoundecaprenol N-acetyl-beta-D-mannosaminyltransferase
MISIDLYFSKVPHNIENVMPGHSKLITCLSYYSYYLAAKSNVKYEEFDYIAIDGILVVRLYNLIHKRQDKTRRISVDMTSLVPVIFNNLILNNKSVYFIGAQQDQVEEFCKIIHKSFQKLNIAGYRNGYFVSLEERLEALKSIIQIKPDVILIGTGTPLQDQMALELKMLGYDGTVYTCGGFIHQTQNNLNYFPTIIDKLNLRLLYRFLHEKNIWKKVFPSLFIFIYHYFRYILKGK